jgi:tetratricopeptide (TPR) repeat protein
MPSPATAVGMPSSATAVGMPKPAANVGMPQTAKDATVLPSRSTGAVGSIVGAELYGDAPPYDESAPGAAALREVGRRAPAPNEFSLEEDPFSNEGAQAAPAALTGGQSSPFDDSDRAAPTGGAGLDTSGALDLDGSKRGQIGDEADLHAPEMDLSQRPAARAPIPIVPIAPKRSHALKIGLVAAVVVGVGGAALTLVPAFGPFGVNFIGDRLNEKKHAASLGELRTAARAELDLDTQSSASRALDRAKQARESMPRHRPTMGYAAYVALARSVRFGKRSEDEGYARQLLAEAGPEPGPTTALARAADDLVAGRIPQARTSLAALATQQPDDLDAAVLSGEVELAAKAPKDAVAAWKRAVKVKSSARTLFGLARAELAAGNADGAKAAAEGAVAASPKHVGARILLAVLHAERDGGEPEALSLLKKVTEDPAIKGESATAELVEAFTLVGRIHLKRSRASAAEAAFSSALKLDPLAVSALVGNGELFYRAGRFSEALSRFDSATRADADDVLARVGTAKTFLALERMKEAKDLLKKIRESRPKEPIVAYWLGRTEHALGNKKEAEAAFVDAIKLGGGRLDTVDAYVALAHLLSATGRAEQASAKLAEASAKFPGLPALHRAKGELAMQTGRFEEAKSELEAALAKDDDLGTRFKLGSVLRRMRSFDEAGKVFDAVAAADKDFPGLALERGLLFEGMGESERALQMYDAALKKAPNDVDLKLRVGSTQVIAGHAEKAEKILREVLKERPTSAEVNHFLGRALLAKGSHLAEAQKYLQKAVEHDPNRAEYHLYLGWAANETGNPGMADASLKRALDLDHDLGDAYWQRGVLLQKQGQTIDALTALQTALEKRPSRYEAYATMALCYGDQQRWADAEQAWRKAIEANDAVPEWHYRLGKLLSAHGNPASAVPELEKATLADKPGKTPTWVADAHMLLAEAVRNTDKAKAIQHYQRFLILAPSSNPYRADAKRALEGLGVRN